MQKEYQTGAVRGMNSAGLQVCSFSAGRPSGSLKPDRFCGFQHVLGQNLLKERLDRPTQMARSATCCFWQRLNRFCV